MIGRINLVITSSDGKELFIVYIKPEGAVGGLRADVKIVLAKYFS